MRGHLMRFLRFYLATLIAIAGLWGQADYTFSDGGRKAHYQMAANEVFSARGTDVKAQAGAKKWGEAEVIQLSKGQTSRKWAKSVGSQSRKQLAPVFYNSADLPKAELLAAMPA